MIRVNNLHKSFEKNEVLKGINEHIEKGEVVVLIGSSILKKYIFKMLEPIRSSNFRRNNF